MEKRLKDLTVVSFETRHAKTLADLIALNGGTPLSAPSLKEVPLEQNTAVFDFAKTWFKNEIDWLILLTGVGTRAMVEVLKSQYDEQSIYEQLRRTQIAPRGPKPIRVLNEWKVPYALTVPEPNTWKELLKALDEHLSSTNRAQGLKQKTVAVQEYGVPNRELMEGLIERGARVISVPVYRWTLPDDLGPMERAIDLIVRGGAHAAVFTTAVQIEHLLQVADRKDPAGGREALRKALKKMVIASVGPDTTDALRQRGVVPDLEPVSPKMGPLIQLLAEQAKDLLRYKQ